MIMVVTKIIQVCGYSLDNSVPKAVGSGPLDISFKYIVLLLDDY